MSFLKYSCLLIVVFLAILGFVLFRFGGSVFSKLLQPVAIVTEVLGNETLKSTDGRTNILILGVDQRSPNNSEVTSSLTDTILVLSIGKTGSSTTLVSIPRDLWVPEINEKINALYAWNYGPYKGRGKDVEKVRSKVESILGMPIHYHALVGFGAFKDSIDAVGGITVDVEESFEDSLYPVEGKENAMPESERYITVKFTKGVQVMDGETALKFARSRHSSNYKEAGDFARARRQQKVIVALKDKILSSSTLISPMKVSDLYDAFNSNVQTDISLKDALLFSSKVSNIEISNINRIVLSDEPKDPKKLGSGMLFSPSSEDRELLYSGKYVLIPKDNSYDEVKALIRTALFCDNSDPTCFSK